MLLRRVMLLVALLLLTAVLANALVERDRSAQRATAPRALPPPAAGSMRHVEATLPSERPVRATVGDLVTLQVRSPDPGDATIDAFGLSSPASEEVPGILEFVATDPGRYPVQLDWAGAALGTVVVAAGR